MRRWLMPVIAGVTMVLSSCTQWPTRLEEIDDHRPRTLDFVYQNFSDTTLCEFAPGDTVLLKAYFAGQPVQSLMWRVSFNVQLTDLGQDTALDVEMLEPLDVNLPPADSCFSDRVYPVSFAFVIPRDIFHRNALIRQAAAQMPLIGGVTLDPDTVLNMIDYFAHLAPDQRATLGGPLYEGLKLHGAELLQLLNAKVRIFAAVNGVHRTVSDLSIRYNRFFTELENVTVNHNPRIHFIGIYKVSGDARPSFKPGDLNTADTTYQLYLSGAADPAMMGPNVVAGDTILIDTGYRYYAVVDTGVFNGVSQLDNGVTLGVDSAGLGTIIGSEPEAFFVQWFYDFGDSAADTIGANNRMVLAGGDPVSPLLPPIDPQIRTVSLWVQLYDSFQGERGRPGGSTLREVTLRFKYSDAYLRAVR